MMRTFAIAIFLSAMSGFLPAAVLTRAVPRHWSARLIASIVSIVGYLIVMVVVDDEMDAEGLLLAPIVFVWPLVVAAMIGGHLLGVLLGTRPYRGGTA